MKNNGRTRSYPVVQMLTKALFLAIPMVILFVVVSWFSFSEIRKQNNLSLESSVNIYQNELEHKLSAIQHFVQWTVVHDPILDAFDKNGHMGDFRYASGQLRLRVTDMQYSTGTEYQYFFYWDEKDIFINASELKVDYETYKLIRDKIKKDFGTNYNWEPCTIGDNTYLYYSITYEHRLLACLVSMEDILSPLSSINLGEKGAIQAMNSDGEIFYETSTAPEGFRGNFYNRLVFPGKEAGLPFSLALYSQVLGNYGRLFFLQFIVFLAVLMLCFIMGGYALVSYRKVILPIKIFSKSLSEMGSVQDGEGLILTDSRVQELNQINDQFKNLIHEITRLRIDIYEAELDKNKFMIHFLQQQIKPHFYLNCLTTIDSMLSLGDVEAAQKMLMFTSRYFRYLFQVNNNFVPLINELAHAEDYLSIQNLRLSRVAEYSTNLPADCNQLNIPPLLLITFVENSIKHATVPDGESLKISIDCRKLLNEENADGDILEIVISDNGQGFDPEVLKKLQDGEDILSDDRSHIGISNCIKRLKLLYNNSFEFLVSNTAPHGASVTLRIPVKV